MGANYITSGSGYSDLRLTLERFGERVSSTLSFYDASSGHLEVRWEALPNWGNVEEGLAILRNPEEGERKSIAPLGEELGKMAFGPPILATLAAHLQSKRIRLWIKPSAELTHIPWEACSFPVGSGPVSGILSMHPGLSLIRDAGGVARPPRPKSKRTKVLIVSADPASPRYPHLRGLEAEVKSVKRALASPECRRFEVHDLQFATPSGLIKALESFRPDILHIIGHGDILPTGGVIVLESGQPKLETPFHGDALAKLLENSAVQVVILTGCQTGDGPTSVGAELAASGVPAVIAMQAPFHDGAAGMFSRAFYGSLGAGESVDDAVLEGRCAIRGSASDWAVPVLIRIPFESPIFSDEFDYELLQEPPQKRHNLAYDDRPFIGRQQERSEIRDRICIKRQRLITITGMGGMGKTRLAKQVAAEALDDFPDGVWMVECDAFETREQLVAGIASAIGIGTSGYADESALVESIGPKKLLLFLDCFERIVDHADLLDTILKRSADCQVIVTSRIVLGLSREYEYRLSPMTVKKQGGSQCDSVALFIEAAGHAVNSFEVTAKNRAQILDLCRELEGVPLALVLAAGRLRHLSLSELLEQIRLHPLEVLRRRGGPKDRQADLHRVVASSFLLLGPRECGLLDKLSLFAGGFFAEDASEVCGWPKNDMIQGLSVLRDHSLVQVQFVDDRSRYKLLDTVREFLEQLPRDETELLDRQECALRHAERYGRTAEEIGSLMSEGRWNEGTSCFWADLGNLRSGFKCSSSLKRHPLTRKFALGLTRLFFETALHSDLKEAIKNGLESAEALKDPDLEQKLLGLAGADAATNKDEAGWRATWARRAEICEAIGNLDGLSDSLGDMAWECVLLGKVEEADQLLTKSAETAARVGDHGLVAISHVMRAQMGMRANDEAETKKWLNLAIESAMLSTNREHLIYLNQQFTCLFESLGDNVAARGYCYRMLRGCVAANRFRGIAWALLKSAEFHETLGELESAAICLMAAAKLQAEFPSNKGERSRALLSQFLKRHEQLAYHAGAFRRTAWLSLVNQLDTIGT